MRVRVRVRMRMRVRVRVRVRANLAPGSTRGWSRLRSLYVAPSQLGGTWWTCCGMPG